MDHQAAILAFICQCHRVNEHHLYLHTRVSSMNFHVGCINYSSLSSLFLIFITPTHATSPIRPFFSRERVGSRDSVPYHPFPWSYPSSFYIFITFWTRFISCDVLSTYTVLYFSRLSLSQHYIAPPYSTAPSRPTPPWCNCWSRLPFVTTH